jgi:hypothetical protein
MKYLFCIPALIIAVTAKAQNAFQVQNVYTGYAVNGNDIVIPTFNAITDLSSNQYFSKKWLTGSVTTTDKNTFGDRLVFMYDKVNNNLYFKNADSDKIYRADMAKVSSFDLVKDNKEHIFIKGDFVNSDYSGKFFEVLILNENKYSLFKLTQTEFQHSQTSAASQAMTESISPGSYVDKATYFLYANHTLTPVELKKKNFAEGLGFNAEKAEDYIKSNKGSFNESYVIAMLNDINGSIK